MRIIQRPTQLQPVRTIWHNTVWIQLTDLLCCLPQIMAEDPVQTQLDLQPLVVNVNQQPLTFTTKSNKKTKWFGSIWNRNFHRNKPKHTLLTIISSVKKLVVVRMHLCAWSSTKETTGNMLWKSMRKQSCKTQWRKKLVNVRFNVWKDLSTRA